MCVCARVCLRTHTAGNIRPRPPLCSHWLCCRQAHLIRSQVGAQPIRTKLEFPLACHSALSAVTSHGPLNGRPQTQLNGLMRPNTPTKNKSLKLSVFSCLCHSGTYIQVHDNDTLWHIWPQYIFYSDYLCECIFSFKVFCINDLGTHSWRGPLKSSIVIKTCVEQGSSFWLVCYIHVHWFTEYFCLCNLLLFIVFIV